MSPPIYSDWYSDDLVSHLPISKASVLQGTSLSGGLRLRMLMLYDFELKASGLGLDYGLWGSRLGGLWT